VNKLIAALEEQNETSPNLLVEPEGLETSEPTAPKSPSNETKDTLLQLFRTKREATPEAFRAELKKYRVKARSAGSK